MTDLILLASGALELALAPRIGGGIARFDQAGADGRTPCLRGAEAGTSGVLDHGCFPLVPFCNRIRGGRFVFRGREVRLAPNMAGDPSPLHGQGWLAPWEVVSAGAEQAELVFRHEAGEWPWAYEARQLFALDPNGLTATLSCRNLSDAPMPCGLGHHPYFPCESSTCLDTGVDCAWTVDGNVLPVDKVAATGRYDLRDRAICGQGLDNGFGGWNGIARIDTPGAPFRLVMSSPDARFFQVYSPQAGGVFVAEPVTHANAALNAPEAEWPELGLRVLAPGEAMETTMRIEVIPS